MKVFLFFLSIILCSGTSFYVGSFLFPQAERSLGQETDGKLNQLISSLSNELSGEQDSFKILEQELSNNQAMIKSLKKQKEDEVKKVGTLTKSLKDLSYEMKKRKSEKSEKMERYETQIAVLINDIKSFEQDRLDQKKQIEAIQVAHIREQKEWVNDTRRQVLKADALGYKRGLDEMRAKYYGGLIKR